MKEVLFQCTEAAAFPQLYGIVSNGGSRFLSKECRDGEDVGLETEQLLTVVAHEVHDLLHLFGIAQHVDLIQDDDNLLAPGANTFQEQTLTLRERTIYRRNEENKVTTRHKLLGETLVFAQDGIDARSINNTDILQEIGGMVDFQNALTALMLPTLLSITDNGNLMRSRNDAFL